MSRYTALLENTPEKIERHTGKKLLFFLLFVCVMCALAGAAFFCVNRYGLTLPVSETTELTVPVTESTAPQTPAKYENPDDLYAVRTVIPTEIADDYLVQDAEGIRVRWVIERLGLGDGIGLEGAIYNEKVIEAVKLFQSENGINPDGNVGLDTWLKMGFSEEDWQLTGAYHSEIRATENSTKYELIEILIERAYDYIGNPYVIGASGPPGEKYGIDCSGLIMQSLYAAGIDMGTITPVTHARPGHEYECRNIWEYGRFRQVEIENRERGDLIFYQDEDEDIIHIAIYLGDDKIIEAWPDEVQISPLIDDRHDDIKGVMRIFA